MGLSGVTKKRRRRVRGIVCVWIDRRLHYIAGEEDARQGRAGQDKAAGS